MARPLTDRSADRIHCPSLPYSTLANRAAMTSPAITRRYCTNGWSVARMLPSCAPLPAIRIDAPATSSAMATAVPAARSALCVSSPRLSHRAISIMKVTPMKPIM